MRRSVGFGLLGLLFSTPVLAETRTAVVAGGCFWCVEANFESVPGVQEVISGYTGGTLPEPSYDDVSAGGTGHYEAVQIIYDSDRVTYAELMQLFFRSIDPTDAGGQFCDRGDSYRSAIFVTTPEERAIAEAAKRDARAELGQKIVTPIRKASTFWPAEDYHQDFYKGRSIILTRAGPKRQASAYKFYRAACGRDARVEALWGADAAFTK